MMIERIGQIDPIQQAKKTTRSESVRVAGDAVALSSEALEKGDLYRAVELVSASADTRADRIAELKKKIDDPSYINDKIISATADKIMDAFGL